MTDLVSVFSMIILFATVSTLTMALFAYIAYKVRERRKPEASGGEKIAKGETFEPMFLRRHMLADIAPSESEDKP